MTISVCTIGAGRAAHLDLLVRGLRASRCQPDELVIGVMQDQLYDLPETDFPIRQIFVTGDGLQLAKARNTAARAARDDLLVFLDIDCIPAPELVGDYADAAHAEGILMGEVRYLPQGATEGGIDWEAFDDCSVEHSERAGPPVEPLGPCSDYRCFWSLNFAISKRTWDDIGGFDEGYDGYGGEDTDFGRMAQEAGHRFWWVRGARAYHQYHRHHMPPVHHLDSVIANAERFRDKWGHHTMEHWLRCFRLMGLAAPVNGRWKRLRPTREEDLQLTRQQEHQPYASSATVLEQLEAREAAPEMALS
ncbi:galactosyltransferase-related protein [Sphingomicrobium sp. XHP0235]|uniref:glycosyltransferase family 2 protein n=1 Tax=Sphingomicrobium aquimarinum TaxID=3133971 RepID=UPI0031FE9F64